MKPSTSTVPTKNLRRVITALRPTFGDIEPEVEEHTTARWRLPVYSVEATVKNGGVRLALFRDTGKPWTRARTARLDMCLDLPGGVELLPGVVARLAEEELRGLSTLQKLSGKSQ